MGGSRFVHIARILAAAGVMLVAASAAIAQTPASPPATLEQPVPPPELNPNATPPETAPQAVPSPNTLAQTPPSPYNYASSASSYSLASVPNMLGDVLGQRYFFLGGGNVSLAAGDRGAKIADDSRPLPTDRVFFDFNDFSQANVTANGAQIGLDRYTIGFEKTFFGGLASIELKAPIDTGLNSTQLSNATTSQNEGTVFGDLQISPKLLIYEDSKVAVAAGVTLDLPTAPRVLFAAPNSGATTQIEDNAVYVEPFLGLQATPTCRLFTIAYLQLDCDVNGDRVTTIPGTERQPERGLLREPTLLYVDWSAGYWLFHDNPCCCRCDCCGHRYLTGVAPIIELHYTTAVQNAHDVAGVAPLSQRVDIFNLTAGAEFELGRCSNLAVGCAAPLRTSPRDKEFGTEIIVQFNRRF